MKRQLVSLAALLALVLAALPLGSASADPIPTLDQSFTAPTTGIARWHPLNYVAQTFTAGTTGLLHAVKIDFTMAPITGQVVVSVMGVTNGMPDGRILTQAFLHEDDFAVINADPLAFTIPLTEDVFVQAGTQYAIEVQFTAYSLAATPYLTWSGATGNIYLGGTAFTASGDTPSNWTVAPDGLDLHFQTYVITGPVSDLKVTRISGPKKAHACQTFKETYRITNLGPDPATRVTVGIGGGDQFEGVSLNGVPGNLTAPFNLAVGQTMTIVAYFKVVAFGFGESRDGFIGATIGSDIYPDVAIDPNPNNNVAGTSIWLVGPPSDGCPR